MWLEEQDLPKNISYIRYLDLDEINEFTIKVINGYLYQMRDNRNVLVNYNSFGQEYIFNITLDKKIIVVPASDTIRHPSLSRGKPVLGCGNIIVTDGKIISLGLESGHYQPTLKDGKQLLKIFESMSIILEPHVPFFYYQDGVKHKTDIVSFKESMQLITTKKTIAAI